MVGREIASRFEAGVPGGEFWATLSKDTVTSKTLTGLAAFCPCQLSKNVAEHTWLADLFLGRSSDADLGTVRRRQSLGLILHLTQAIASDPDTGIEVETFREAC